MAKFWQSQLGGYGPGGQVGIPSRFQNKMKKFSFHFHFIFILLLKEIWEPWSTKCEKVAVQIWFWELKELGLRTENFGVRKPKSTASP